MWEHLKEGEDMSLMQCQVEGPPQYHGHKEGGVADWPMDGDTVGPKD